MFVRFEWGQRRNRSMMNADLFCQGVQRKKKLLMYYYNKTISNWGMTKID